MIFAAGGGEGRNVAVACTGGEPTCKISPHDSYLEIEI